MRRIFLTDNGSLRPEATLNLRKVAGLLSNTTGQTIEPVSLLHSSKVPAENLDGEPARTVGPAIREAAEQGEREFLILPFFFGPSRALTDYLPRRIAQLEEEFPGLDVLIAKPLTDLEGPADSRLARILKEGVLACIPEGNRPPVILVDHGSPEPAVTAVRNVLAGQLSLLLEGEVSRVVPASMERREGEEFAFSDPLLEDLLNRTGSWENPVIISMLFLSPGRHAGPDGDVTAICREAEKRNPGLQTVMTSLVGEHDGVAEILADRLEEALGGGI